MVNPKFKSIHDRNFKDYHLSEEKYKDLKAKRAIIIGTFIDDDPIVFYTDDPEANLIEFIAKSTKDYNDMLKAKNQ